MDVFLPISVPPDFLLGHPRHLGALFGRGLTDRVVSRIKSLKEAHILILGAVNLLGHVAKRIKAASQQLGCGEIVLDHSVGLCHHRVLESGGWGQSLSQSDAL